jgi:ubiquinone/menaquinone biosynthesis C-methylase UbiE
MPQINLMQRYPRSTGRNADRPEINGEAKRISKQFGREYFDGDRRYGYGGYTYHPRFWTETVKYIRDFYQLADDASILDVGCAKGFMLYDFQQLMPNARLAGIDISEYAVANALEAVKPLLQIGNAKTLPYPDKSYDLVLAINTIHNLPYAECRQSLREIQRVSRHHAFVMVDAYRTETEHEAMLQWVLTAETMLQVDDWIDLFKEAGYTGDYYWWIVEQNIAQGRQADE